MPNRAVIIGTLAVVACSGSATTLSPAAEGARRFRPLSGLFFLPEKSAAPTTLPAELVPDSKIQWDLQVTASNLGLHGVEVRVREQIVTLSGVVPTQDAEETMLRAARATTGVRGVQSTLKAVP